MLREGVSARLRQARLLHNALWLWERRLARGGGASDLDLFFLDISGSGHQIHTDLGNPAAMPDRVAIGLERLRDLVAQGDAGWIREIERAPNPHPVTSWGSSLRR